MEVPKKSYSRRKEVKNYEVELKMKNYEGRNSGSLQHKVWNPGILQSSRNDDSETYEQQQTK